MSEKCGAMNPPLSPAHPRPQIMEESEDDEEQAARLLNFQTFFKVKTIPKTSLSGLKTCGFVSRFRAKLLKQSTFYHGNTTFYCAISGNAFFDRPGCNHDSGGGDGF